MGARRRVANNPEAAPPNAVLHLANCYLQLGSKEMANDLMKKVSRYPYGSDQVTGRHGRNGKSSADGEQLSPNRGVL